MAWMNFGARGALALLALGLAATPALSQKKYGPGVTDKEIKIGTTTPFSGPASAYSAGAVSATAWFQKINDEGGVNGRKINYIALDDAYSPPKTVEQIRKLIESEEVLFLVNPVGTATNNAVVKYINQKQVPHLFIGTGATMFNDPEQFPWTMSWTPHYASEGEIYAKYILQIEARCEDRHHLAERRSRARLHPRLQARARRQGRDHDRLGADLQHHRSHGRLADRFAEVGRRRCAGDLRGAEILGAGDPQGL